jgi:hypothetical protein
VVDDSGDPSDRFIVTIRNPVVGFAIIKGRILVFTKGIDFIKIQGWAPKRISLE